MQTRGETGRCGGARCGSDAEESSRWLAVCAADSRVTYAHGAGSKCCWCEKQDTVQVRCMCMSTAELTERGRCVWWRCYVVSVVLCCVALRRGPGAGCSSKEWQWPAAGVVGMRRRRAIAEGAVAGVVREGTAAQSGIVVMVIVVAGGAKERQEEGVCGWWVYECGWGCRGVREEGGTGRGRSASV